MGLLDFPAQQSPLDSVGLVRSAYALIMLQVGLATLNIRGVATNESR